MASSTSNFDRFVRAVYRRLVLLRAAEAMGVGTLGAAGIALVFVPVLLWRGQSALVPSIILLFVGAGAGLVGFFFRRPSVAEAAGEADRQLNLQDLLTTAWGLRSRSIVNEFERAVLAVAEVKCHGLPASMVILHRLGGRAWGGIGLASALVLALGWLSVDPIESRAHSNSARGADPGAKVEERGMSSEAERFASGAGRRSPIARDDPEEDEGGGDRSTLAKSAENEQPQGTERRADGAGVGRAGSPGNTGDARTRPGGASGRGPDAGGDAAGGAGTASANGSDRGASSGVVSSAGTSQITPAWQSRSWAEARQRAGEAVRSNRVPAEYHELMRAYFER